MQESLAFVAGYGIKCYLICQDINQLKSRETGYGHDEASPRTATSRTPTRLTVSRLPNTYRG
jgi:type IV secretory pathway TraG/TraD family ATPase VirD4